MEEAGAIRNPPSRWLIAIMGTLLQLCLGTVYAWSYFQKPVMNAFGLENNKPVTLTFSVAICFLGIAAAWGGINLSKHGPRKLAMTGGALFAIGYLLAALALYWKSLALLYVGYGVIGGVGLGLSYVTPVATAAKWFPDKKGLVTGMVVMGFGFGALLMSKVLGPILMTWTGGNLVTVFAALGVFFAVFTLIPASFLKNPPVGYAPAGYVPAKPKGAGGPAAEEASALACLGGFKFAMMWVMFFCNITAGISIISLQSPLMQDLWKRIDPSLAAAVLAGYGATLIAISSLFNGAGRFFWGGLSDRIGRIQAFRTMLVTQIVGFGLLIWTGNPWIFGALVCYVLLCYGGGFGTMPSFVLDVYGPKMMPVMYGVILTAWSAGGVVGPLIFAAIKDQFAKDTARAATYSFITAGAFLAVGLAVSLWLTNEPFRPKTSRAGSRP
jgi:OFA family oxalate/formate antiporter-like MFS transporter